MSRIAVLMLCVLALALGFACASAEKPLASQPPQDTSPNDVAKASIAAQGRLVVRNATAGLVVSRVEESLSRIGDMAREMGGWVESSAVEGEGAASSGRVVVRVPVDQLDTALERLRQMATRVDSLETTSEDVTAQYTDLDSRLRNSRAAEQQLLEIMDRATSVQDVLSVQRELTNVRSEIEHMEGQKRVLDQSIVTSKITVSLTPATDTSPLLPRGWSFPEQVSAATRALVAVAVGLANLAIWAVVFAPLWTALAVFAWVINRRYRRQKPMPPAPAETPPS